MDSLIFTVRIVSNSNNKIVRDLYSCSQVIDSPL